MMVLTFASISTIHSMETQEFETGIPADVTCQFLIIPSLASVVLGLGSEVSFNAISSSFGYLRLVCKEWRGVIDTYFKLENNDAKKKFLLNEIIKAYDSIGHGEACRQFLFNGKLIYKPCIEGRQPVELFFSDLEKPLGGVFDLSSCENVGSYTYISTGYCKSQIPENKKKVGIWFLPRFLIEVELEAGRALHLKEVFTNDWSTDAPVGIFWTWDSNWDGVFDLALFNSLTCQSAEKLSNGDLYQKWRCRSLVPYRDPWGLYSIGAHPCSQKFHVHFVSQE